MRATSPPQPSVRMARRVVTSDSAKTGYIFDAETGAKLVTLSGSSATARRAAFSPDGSRVVAVGGLTVYVFDAETGATLARLEGHTKEIWAAVFSPDATRILTGSIDGTARLFDAETGAALATFECGNRVMSAAFSPDGTRVVAAGRGRMIRL